MHTYVKILKFRQSGIGIHTYTYLKHWHSIVLSEQQVLPCSRNVMHSVQSATEQQEHIGSFKRRLRKRRNGAVDDGSCANQRRSVKNIFVLTDALINLSLLQKEYVKQFYFEKSVGSGGQYQEKFSTAWHLLLVNASANFG